jgi:hypothetical protein
MAFRRTRIVGGPEDTTRQRAKRPSQAGSAIEPVHADPHALQSGHIISAGVQGLQRTIGNCAVSEMIAQRQTPEEEEPTSPAAASTVVSTGPGPIPIPYPNKTDVSSTSGVTPEVKIPNKKTAVSPSVILKSSGGEGGTFKGMALATNTDKMKFKSSSSKVVFQGNRSSTVGSLKEPEQTSASTPAETQVKPSQTKVRIEDED